MMAVRHPGMAAEITSPSNAKNMAMNIMMNTPPAVKPHLTSHHVFGARKSEDTGRKAEDESGRFAFCGRAAEWTYTHGGVTKRKLLKERYEQKVETRSRLVEGISTSAATKKLRLELRLG
jgi:hypothetical protein